MLTFALSVSILAFAGLTARLQAEPPPEAPSDPYRECSSRGTIFEDMPNLDQVTSLFSEKMGMVADERQKILEDPSKWECESPTEPDMPELTSLAEGMPGWHYRRATISFTGQRYTTVLRPVTFETFSSIVGEFLREYECKVSELQADTFWVVTGNEDYPPETSFCCTTNECEPISVAETRCIGEVTEDPQCDGKCSLPDLSQPDAASRLPAFSARARPERYRARVAVDRTLRMMRSYELEHETIRHLMCLQRVSLDLLNQTALLAEAVSCMPKIWDAATSLHDPKQEE